MTNQRDDDKFLEELADAILDGKTAPGTPQDGVDPEQRAALRQAEILARIADLHQHLPDDDTALTGSVETGSVPLSWGRLTILEELGRGAFGAVYRARDPRLDREVALKLLWPGGAHPDRFIASLVEEGRLLARIHHPNVVSIYDANVIDGRVGLTMEFVRGQTLSQEFQARGPFAPHDAASVGVEIARALAAVHEAGLLHRDVKAQNVMRRTDGRLVLMDFGAGRPADGGTGEDAAITGTPLYLAPEVLDHQRATVQSDLYSLGVLLFYLLTGAYPVSGNTIRELREAHRSGRRQTVAEARPDVPAAIAAVVDRALGAAPSERWASAAEMATALASIDAPPRARSKVGLVALVGLMTLLGAVLAFVLGRQERADDGTLMMQRLTFSDIWLAGRLSRDGRYLPYSAGEGSQLMLRDLASGTDRSLTTDKPGSGWIDYSVISRDGALVAYSWETNGARELRVLDVAEPRRPRVVLRDTTPEAAPGAVIEPVDWTPDRSSILALRSRTGESYEIVLIDSSNGSVRTIKDGLPWRVSMSLSHDGRFVAFDHPDPRAEDARDISIVAIDGGKESAIVTGPSQDTLPVWMAGDLGLLYTSDRSGTYGLLTIPIRQGRPAGPPQLIRRDSGRIVTMTLGDDGTLFYLLESGNVDVQTANLDSDGNVDPGSIQVAATSYIGANLDPAWSPDGRTLAYVSRRRTMGPRRQALVIRSLIDRTERVLWPNLDGFIEPRWSPDGRLFLTRGNDTRGQRGPWLIDASSGVVTARVGGPGFSDMEWAPDGRSLFVTVQDRVGRFDLTSRRIQDIHRDARGRNVLDLAVSPDGRWFAIRVMEKREIFSIDVFPASGGPAREIFSTTRPDIFLLQDWTRDGANVLISRGRDQGSDYIRGDWEVWSVPVNGGQPRTLNLTGPRLRGLTVNPDGAQLAYRVGDPGADEWIMRKFLPAQ